MEALERDALELIAGEKYDEALEFLKAKAEEHQGDDLAVIYELLARVHSIKGEIKDAQYNVEIADILYFHPSFFKYVDSVLIQGERLLEESKFSDAREIYERGALLLPEHKETFENRLANISDIEKEDAARRDAIALELVKADEEEKNKQDVSKKKKKKTKNTNKAGSEAEEEEKNKQDGSKKKKKKKKKKTKNTNEAGSEVQIEETTVLVPMPDGSPSKKVMSDSHIECEEKKYESFTVTCDVTLFGDSCCGTMTSDYSEQILKSFLIPTPRQVEKFNELHSICSSNTSLLNVENVIKDRVKASPLLVTERVYPLKSFFDLQLENFSSENPLTEKTWWNHIANLFGQIFRDVGRGLMFLFISQYRWCGDLAFSIYVTSDGRGKILPSLNPAENAHQDIEDLVSEMGRILFLPFEEDKGKKDLSGFELPLELRRLLEFVHPTYYRRVPATFLVDHPYFWTVGDRVKFVMKLKTWLKKHRCPALNEELEQREPYCRWDGVLDGVYAEVYAKGGSSKEDELGPMSRDTYKVRSYESGLDIVRYFGSVYVHVNDTEYRYARELQDFSEERIEHDLLSFFPKFYADICECICVCVQAGDFKIQWLREISTYYDKNELLSVIPTSMVPFEDQSATKLLEDADKKPISTILIFIATHTEAESLVNRFQLTKAVNSVFPKDVNWVHYHGLYKSLRITIAQPNSVSGASSVGVITESLVIYASIEALKPDLIINAGTAGGLKAKGAASGDVFLASEVAFHDIRIPIPVFDLDVVGLQQPLSTPNMIEELKLKIGKLSTGNSSDISLQDDASINANDATVRDVEGAVVAYVANVLKVPVIFLKAVPVVTDIDDGEVSKNLNAGRTALDVTVAKVVDFIYGKSLSEL